MVATQAAIVVPGSTSYKEPTFAATTACHAMYEVKIRAVFIYPASRWITDVSLAVWAGFTLPSAIALILFALGIARYGDVMPSGLCTVSRL